MYTKFSFRLLAKELLRRSLAFVGLFNLVGVIAGVPYLIEHPISFLGTFSPTVIMLSGIFASGYLVWKGIK